jgi:hypothetical protein
VTSGALVNDDILVGFAAPPQGSATNEIDMLCENRMPIGCAIGNRVGFVCALHQPERVTKAEGK